MTSFDVLSIYCSAAMLQCCNAAMLQCCNAAMLQCCNAAMHWSDLLDNSRKTASKVSALIVFRIFRTLKEVHLQTRIAVLGRGFENAERSQGQTKFNSVNRVDVVQLARNCHRKTLLSLLPYVALHFPHARRTFFHRSPPRATISVRIFRIW
jgi:hypothetical protein